MQLNNLSKINKKKLELVEDRFRKGKLLPEVTKVRNQDRSFD